MIRITCPHCNFTREMPENMVPDKPVRVTCPKCKREFEFDKESIPSPPPLPKVPSVPPPIPSASPSQFPLTPPPIRGKEESRTTGNRVNNRELMSVGELFAATWTVYKQRWLLIIGLFIATALGAVAPPLLIVGLMGGFAKGSFGATVGMFMLLGLAIIASFLFVAWGMAATISAAVDERLGFSDSFTRANGCWLSLLWVTSLYSFIVGGASLLFLVPGILTSIWFFAAAYLVVAEDVKGMDALLKSKALVDGRFWPVLGRLILLWILGMVLGMIPVVGPLLSLAMAPFSMLFAVVLYRNLSETAGSVSWSSTDGTKAAWLLLGLAGYILIPLMLFFILGAAFFSYMEPMLKMFIPPGKVHQIFFVEPMQIIIPFFY